LSEKKTVDKIKEIGVLMGKMISKSGLRSYNRGKLPSSIIPPLNVKTNEEEGDEGEGFFYDAYDNYDQFEQEKEDDDEKHEQEEEENLEGEQELEHGEEEKEEEEKEEGYFYDTDENPSGAGEEVADKNIETMFGYSRRIVIHNYPQRTEFKHPDTGIVYPNAKEYMDACIEQLASQRFNDDAQLQLPVQPVTLPQRFGTF
jgi:hypothetical protein